jgi:hypothetical protein
MCSVPMESCLCVRAASCASTTLCRFRSVNRSNGAGAWRFWAACFDTPMASPISLRRRARLLGLADVVTDELVAEVGKGLGAQVCLADAGQVVGLRELLVEAGDQVGEADVERARRFSNRQPEVDDVPHRAIRRGVMGSVHGQSWIRQTSPGVVEPGHPWLTNPRPTIRAR